MLTFNRWNECKGKKGGVLLSATSPSKICADDKNDDEPSCIQLLPVFRLLQACSYGVKKMILI